MIAYLDTSALVKLYVTEHQSDLVRSLVVAADAVATSAIAYVEARSAIARRVREGLLPDNEANRMRTALRADWPRLLVIPVLEELCLEAGDLVEAHALRGFDAVHLAAALELSGRQQRPVVFACWDARLCAAGVRCGLTVVGALNPTPGDPRDG